METRNLRIGIYLPPGLRWQTDLPDKFSGKAGRQKIFVSVFRILFRVVRVFRGLNGNGFTFSFILMQ